MKKPVKITLFSIGGTATVALILAIVLGLNYFFNNFGEVMTDIFVWLSDADVPQPTEDYGEFPFKLVYEDSNGQQIVVEDTLVIEYLGYGFDWQNGKHNKWDAYFLSDRNKPKNINEIILYQGDSATIFFELGSCEYYMGIKEAEMSKARQGILAGDIGVKTGYYLNAPISDEELYEKYNIKIIEKRLSPPLTKAG